MERLQSSRHRDRTNRRKVSPSPNYCNSFQSTKLSSSSSGGANTTSPSSWTNSSLAAIFAKKYPKTITDYWPYNSTNTTSSDTSSPTSSGLPKWAGAVIGVLVGLFAIGLLLFGWWFWRRRQRKRRDSVPPAFGKTSSPREADGTEVRQLMYGSGPTSPMPGPQSTSTGMETGTHQSSAQDSVLTSVSPRTVESGGGTVYEMHGMWTHFYSTQRASNADLVQIPHPSN